MKQTNETTHTDLNELLNNGYNFTEKKVIALKQILKDSCFEEIPLKTLMAYDETEYKSHKVKRVAYVTAIKKMGFQIIKRVKSRVRKRIRTNTLHSIPDYVFNTFWIIQINQNDDRQ